MRYKAPAMGPVRYGTSSWSEKSWIGSFYPGGAKPTEFLPHYFEHFGVVEADTTYYGIPKPATVDAWRDRIPDGCEMAAKFPRTIVHAGDGPRPDPGTVLVPEKVKEETDGFLATMGRLGDRLGPLVLQFPYFRRDAFANRGEFLERLDRYLEHLPKRDFRYAVEVRNAKWLDTPLAHILRRHGAALVLVEMPRMPHPADLARRLDVVTSDFSYARLIGDRRATEKAAEAFDRVVLDKSESLRRWAQLLKSIAVRIPRVYAFSNNHYAGHAPDTIRTLRDLVDGAP